MRRPPHKMRPREARELARLFGQLMADIGARRANPCEWETMASRGPCRVSCIPDVPVIYFRLPDGRRWAHAPPIGKALDVFVSGASFIAERIRAP